MWCIMMSKFGKLFRARSLGFKSGAGLAQAFGAIPAGVTTLNLNDNHLFEDHRYEDIIPLLKTTNPNRVLTLYRNGNIRDYATIAPILSLIMQEKLKDHAAAKILTFLLPHQINSNQINRQLGKIESNREREMRSSFFGENRTRETPEDLGGSVSGRRYTANIS